jgi:outer membrane protein TolC
MKYSKIVLATITAAMAQYATAADLTLSDSLTQAEQNSPMVRKADAAKEEASWKKTEAFSIFLPRINATGSRLLDEKFMTLPVPQPDGSFTIFPMIEPYTNWGVNASWVFFDGLANYDHYSSASYYSDAAQKDADWARFQVHQDVKVKFYRALAAVELEKVANQNVKTLEDHLTRARALFKSGAGTNFDVLRVEVQMNEAESEKLNSEDNTILARSNFLDVLGVDDQAQSLAGQLPTPDVKKLQGLSKPTVNERLDYQAIQDRELAAHKAYVASYKAWVPSFALNAGMNYYNNLTKGINEQNYNNAYSVGITMTWNLFDGFASTAKLKEAHFQEIQQRETVRQASIKNNYDFDFWKRRYAYSATLYKAKLSDVAKAEESVRLSTQSFKAGTRTSSEVLDAELDLFRARAGVVNAQLNAAESLVNLELALGKEL